MKEIINSMKEIIRCGESDYPELRRIWERSVRATHHFITEDVIDEIRADLISAYFPNVDLYAVCDDGAMAGFLGVASDRIEMLFIDDGCRGRGHGSKLIEFAKSLGCRHVDVNEQNSAALKFYLNHGFHVAARDATDDCGRPFPILHLSL